MSHACHKLAPRGTFVTAGFDRARLKSDTARRIYPPVDRHAGVDFSLRSVMVLTDFSAERLSQKSARCQPAAGAVFPQDAGRVIAENTPLAATPRNSRTGRSDALRSVSHRDTVKGMPGGEYVGKP